MRAIIQKTFLYAALIILTIPASATAQTGMRDGSVLCRFLTPQDNVTGADYVPDVDVRGRAVVPADVSGRVYAHNDVVKIPVDIDLVQFSGLSGSLPAGAELTGNFGMLEIYKDNTVIYNGAVITDQAYAYCGQGERDADQAPQILSAPQDNGIKTE